MILQERAFPHMLRKSILLIILPLTIGIGIYVFFRSNDLLIYSWVPMFKTVKNMININAGLGFVNPIIKNYILFSLPDGMWLYSFTSTMILIWINSNSKYKYLWIMSGGIIAIVNEIGQGIGLFKGTYDVNDLITYIISMIVAIIVTRKYFKGV